MSAETSGYTFMMLWRNAVCDSDLSAMARLVAHTLSTNMNASGFAYPSQETLARRAGLGSKRTTQKATKELIAAGFLRLTRQSIGRGTHHYQALIPTAHEMHGCAPTAQDMHGSDTPTVHMTTSNRARGAHESFKESERSSRARARDEDHAEGQGVGLGSEGSNGHVPLKPPPEAQAFLDSLTKRSVRTLT